MLTDPQGHAENSIMKNLLSTFILLVTTYVSQAQCPTSGTISADCTSTNLTISGNTLNVNAGVTVTVTGTLTINNSSTINGSGAFFNVGSFNEAYGTLNTISGGTYTVANTFNTGGGGDFTATDVTVNASGTSSINGSDIIFNNSDFTVASMSANLSSWIISSSSITTNDTGDFDLEDANVTDCTFNIGGEMTVSSGDCLISNSDIDVGVGFATEDGQNALSMNGGGTLTVENNTDMYIKGHFINNEFYIDNSDVIVTGDFDNAGAEILEVTNNGTLQVGGDFDNSGSGNTTIDGGGTVQIDGDYDNTGGGNTVIENGGMTVNGSYSGNAPTGSDSGGTCSGGAGCCGSSCGSLPVSLTYFEVIDEFDGITLRWETASELNNDYFNVLRSRDGVSFDLVAQIDGNGTTNETIQYQWKDYTTPSGPCYYQLEQVDYDGTNEFFEIKRVDVGQPVQAELKVYPVPVASAQDVYAKLLEGDIQVQSAYIKDLSGRISHELPYSIEINKVRFHTSELSLSPGLYLITVKTAQTEWSGRVLIR